MKTILSLFDFSGNWPKPYREAGFNVVSIDIKNGTDILSWDYTQLENVVGILAAPPCTDFSVSGAQYWKVKDADGRTDAALALIDKTLEIIEFFKPQMWALENPVGRLPKLRPSIGKPWYFNPCEFGKDFNECYTKKTGIWGKFNKPQKNPCNPEDIKTGNNTWLMKLGGKSERTKELRSMTPMGFAYAFFNANKDFK